MKQKLYRIVVTSLQFSVIIDTSAPPLHTHTHTHTHTLLVVNGKTRQKISEEIEDLNNTVRQLDLIRCTEHHPTIAGYSFFSNAPLYLSQQSGLKLKKKKNSPHAQI